MQTVEAGPLPVRIVAGPHSGHNAEWIAAAMPPGRGRWLWLLGALQRPLAVGALERAPAAVRERLIIGGLPGGCPCCAAGSQLAAGLARSLRQQRRSGVDVAGLILQVEPEGDPARTADNLLGPEVEAWLRIDHIDAVIGAEDLGGAPASASASAPAPARSPRTLRCLGPAARVHVRQMDPDWASLPPEATRVGPDWAGALVPARKQVPEPGLALEPGLRQGSERGQRQGSEQERGLRQGQEQAQGRDQAEESVGPEGWVVFEHDPFAGLAGSTGVGASWQELARWPASVRFDRRAVPAWLQALRQGLNRGKGNGGGAPVELALIARTERDWLGWRPGASEVPLAWRSGSRLAWLSALPAGRNPRAGAGIGVVGAGAPDVSGIMPGRAQDLPADIVDGLALAPLLSAPG